MRGGSFAVRLTKSLPRVVQALLLILFVGNTAVYYTRKRVVCISGQNTGPPEYGRAWSYLELLWNGGEDRGDDKIDVLFSL